MDRLAAPPLQQHHGPPIYMSTPQLVKVMECVLCNPEIEEASLARMLAHGASDTFVSDDAMADTDAEDHLRAANQRPP